MRRLAAEADMARDAAEQANAVKSRFVATMSHELRTPLNGILAVAEALTKRPLAKRDRELAELIRSSGGGLLSILNEVLDLARIEAGAARLEPEAFALPPLIAEIGEVWRVAAEAKGLHLEIAADEDLPQWAWGDSERLRQVLSNLLNNAIKFTERGRVRLQASRGVADVVRFAVVDSGPGIAPEDRERLFMPFAQGDASITRRHGGAGLGLAICRELAMLMGGEIHAEAGPEGGAAMVLALALPAVAAPERVSEVAADNDDGVAMDPLILVAEDHPLNRRVIAIVLEQAGLRFRYAEDGQAALEAVADGDFDVVLMDVHMPRLDGLEATRRIRALADPARRDIPIIAVTANASLGEIEACREAGMDAVVGKPISAMELLSTIARLSARKAVDEERA
jgi:CheY-like chemotaxis protein